MIHLCYYDFFVSFFLVAANRKSQLKKKNPNNSALFSRVEIVVTIIVVYGERNLHSIIYISLRTNDLIVSIQL